MSKQSRYILYFNLGWCKLISISIIISALISTDINGAGNILRKVIGDVVYNNQPIMGLMFNPIKYNI